MAEKNGDAARTSSWAAKARCSGPTQSVMMGEVSVLAKVSRGPARERCSVYLPTGGLVASGALGRSTRFEAAAWSRKDRLDLLTDLPARCFEKLSV